MSHLILNYGTQLKLHITTIYLRLLHDFKEIIENFTIPRKKLLILDLDNTLWGGEIGDLGGKRLI